MKYYFCTNYMKYMIFQVFLCECAWGGGVTGVMLGR